jgi:hypothetical protein
LQIEKREKTISDDHYYFLKENVFWVRKEKSDSDVEWHKYGRGWQEDGKQVQHQQDLCCRCWSFSPIPCQLLRRNASLHQQQQQHSLTLANCNNKLGMKDHESRGGGGEELTAGKNHERREEVK